MARCTAKQARRAYRDDVWLEQYDAGARAVDLAAKAGVSKRTVLLGVKSAREAAEAIRNAPPPPPRPPWWLRLEPLFPCESYTPESRCPHHGPLKDGTMFVCMVCHKSAYDDIPFLQLDPATDPKPEPKPPKPKGKPAKTKGKKVA